ncbi:BspA family leucine-rich repeat surface protein, partial [Enterococcus faecalis]|uniref:BspA family leucine-rich repeat surface protein n=1 Tax=Enterococcus faecalis TaxID=1351 RepID=UPI001A964E1C
TDSKEIIEKALEKDSLLPTNPSVPSVQPDTNPSDAEQKETSPSEKEKSQKQEETTSNKLNTEENNMETSESSMQEDSQKQTNSIDTALNNISKNEVLTTEKTVIYNNTMPPKESYTWKENYDNFLGNVDGTGTFVISDYIGTNPDIRVPHAIRSRAVKFGRTFLTNIAARGARSFATDATWWFANGGSAWHNDLSFVFENAPNLESVDLSNLNLFTITSFNNAFRNCQNLKSVKLNPNLSAVTDMHAMFVGCVNLVDVDLNNLYAPLLEDASDMFAGCFSLTNFKGTAVNTEKLKNTHGLFYNAISLKTVDLTGWNFSQVTDTGFMFGCSTVSIENNGTNGKPMQLESIIGLENANFNNVDTMSSMFQNTPNLQYVPVETWKAHIVKNLSWMFFKSGITKFDISQTDWWLLNVDTMESMFTYSKVNEVRFGQAGSNPWKVSNMINMFYDTPNLKYVDTEKWRIDHLSSTKRMFQNSGIEKIDLSTWNPIQTNIDMSYMFTGAAKLREVDMRGFTNLDSQTTTNLLGTGQAANPIMLIVQDSSGNTNFLNRDFVKESGRSVYSEFPKLVANGGKFEDGSNELSYI